MISLNVSFLLEISSRCSELSSHPLYKLGVTSWKSLNNGVRVVCRPFSVLLLLCSISLVVCSISVVVCSMISGCMFHDLWFYAPYLWLCGPWSLVLCSISLVVWSMISGFLYARSLCRATDVCDGPLVSVLPLCRMKFIILNIYIWYRQHCFDRGKHVKIIELYSFPRIL